MKKICILGIGNAQLDAINYCKEKGYKVYACSYNDQGRDKAELDDFKIIDIKDIEGVKKYVIDNKIDIVYSVGSDIAMPTVAKVSEELNLPHFITYETAQICQNKYQLRKVLGEDFEGNVKFKLIKSKDEIDEWREYPAILKPVDSQGQRGVRLINNKIEFEKYFDDSMSYSVRKELIIEEYIDGPEVSVNAFAVNGEVIFALVSDRIVFEDLPGGIIKEHVVPTSFCSADVEKKVREIAISVMNKLGILNGPAYFQIKIMNGVPKIIEVTPRLDGCHMWNLIKHYTGVNLLSMTLDYLMRDLDVDFNEVRGKDLLKNEPKTLKFLCEETGVKYNREKYNVDKAEYLQWYYENGDIVKKINGYMEKGGYIIEKI
ncbi:ATP-grasp domain-containing protein [Clostridium isatidis]|uniref:Carboxylate--amine ligase n=1 Tax=Clostridium isatidis TaxID=182773 RepID=A0A343JA93_9CLOT|nr:ATP-grasp domain-containing protein [Clostridium isatidis]ASW42451.1 carboxylate--amine ligase [Clostridium isatidis]